MMIPFHIDQINEMLNYLDQIPHKFGRNLIDFIKNHTEEHIKSTEDTAKKDVAEIQQSVEADVAKIQQ